MIPNQMILPAWRNQDYTEEFTVQDGETLIDVSGYDLRMHIRKYATSPDVLKQLNRSYSFTAEGLFVNDVGKITLLISRSTIQTVYDIINTSPFDDRLIKASYDVLFIPPDGLWEVWLQGQIEIQPGVTF